MTNKPQPWISAVLGLLLAPVAMLHVGRPRLALGYFVASLAIALVGFAIPTMQPMSSLAALLLAVTGAVHAYRLAKQYPDSRPRPAYSRWWGLVGVTAGVCALVIVLRAFVFEPFRAPSSSMLPSVPVGATLVAQKWGYGNYKTYGMTLLRRPVSAELHRGDLIVFEFPPDRSTSFVKRVMGLPGDRVSFRRGQVFINGQAVPQRPDGEFYDEPSHRSRPRFVESLSGVDYAVLTEPASAAAMARMPSFPQAERCVFDAGELSCDVPAGHYFVLGDNRDNSNDSRFWGFVPADHLVGRIVWVSR